MSAWATQRKFFIFFSTLVGVSIICISSIFFILYEPESCSDGLRNQSELGIDCGGECPNVCIVPPKKLLTLWSRAFPLADGIYSAIAYIENQNKDLYIPKIQYRFRFFDSKGVYITYSSDYATILPNGITPIIVPFVGSDERVIESVEFSFVNDPVFETYPEEDASFDVLNTELKNPETSPKLNATVLLSSGPTVKEVEFVAIVYDQNDNAIATSKTVQENMRLNEIRELHFTWVNPFVLLDAVCPGGLCKQSPERVEIIPLVTRR